MDKLKVIFCIMAMLTIPQAKISAAERELTLCHDFEEIYFSCEVDRKIVSVCASGNISPENGYVQYRYGTPDRLELQFPSEPSPPKKRLVLSEISEGNVQFTHLKFRSGNFSYVLYQGFPSGLYIKKNGETIFNKNCQTGEYQRLSQRAYRGIITVAPEDGVDQ